jgi:hypothetical protein
VVPVIVGNCELKIAVERRRRYRFPHEALMRRGSGKQFDLDQGI